MILLTATLTLTALILDDLFPLNIPDEGQPSGQSFRRLVVDEQDEPLRAFADVNGIWRYQVSVESVSPYYLEALINYEDRWFYWHPGVNPVSLLRASWQNLWSEDIVSGASTLTIGSTFVTSAT